MKVIAIIDADFERGPLGTRSRLSESLAGEPVLRRTVRRVLEARRPAGVHCVVPAEQAGAAREVLAGLAVRVETHEEGRVPWCRWMTSARKWSLDAWRGGIGGTTVFDESLHPWVAAALVRRESAEAVALVPGAAALIDPVLLDAMIAHYEKVREEVRLTFTQSAPGLTACIYSHELLADLAQKGQFIGRVMAYRPADPQREMNIQPCFYPVDNEIACAAGRCLADTQGGFDYLFKILADLGDQADARTVSRWLTQHQLDVPELPDEVEVELTTQDTLPATTLRPRGSSVPRRGPLSEAVFEQLVGQLAQRDDARLVLGGFGDPLLHPQCLRLLNAARAAGVFGLALRTPAVTLDAAAVEQIVTARVDVVNVLLDAHTPETYAAVHGADHFQRVRAHIDALLDAARRPGNGGVPIVVCEMIKTRQTMPEMEAFYDHWLSRGCGAVIAGPSRYAGRWPDIAVMDMSPPTRFACMRVFRRCMVLADGAVALCDQDVAAAHVIGRLGSRTLRDIWQQGPVRDARSAHLDRRWDTPPLCSRCNEWHRP